jgi:6-phosphogluconolactonase (cycloisomerase 2 family)
LLQRDRDDVTSMSGMALDNTGNVVVTLKDDQGIGRVNAYNMQGDSVLAVKISVPNPKFPPFFTSVAVDKEGRILVVEFHEMAVHIYGKNGEFILKIGQGGRTAQQGIFENISCLSISQNNEIYVCDPLRNVQVCMYACMSF